MMMYFFFQILSIITYISNVKQYYECIRSCKRYKSDKSTPTTTINEFLSLLMWRVSVPLATVEDGCCCSCSQDKTTESVITPLPTLEERCVVGTSDVERFERHGAEHFFLYLRHLNSLLITPSWSFIFHWQRIPHTV